VPSAVYLIGLADAEGAVIVTGDTDLQGLAHRIPVCTPAAFRTLLIRP
jgi:hypothetical protein